MPKKNRRIRRVLNDWTFLGLTIVTTAFILSIVVGRTTPSVAAILALLGFWVIVLILQYDRILEVLEETRDSRAELNAGIRKLHVSSYDVDVAKKLTLISMEAWVDLEAKLEPGDSVLVFANTLELDHQSMFDVVVNNLKKGVSYRFILFENDQADAWDKFTRSLQRKGVSKLPKAVFDSSKIATLLRSSTVIYDFGESGKRPEGFCALASSQTFDTCVLLSQEVARQTRDAFNRVWRSLDQGSDGE